MNYSVPGTIAGIVDHRARTARLQWLALAVVASIACGAAAVLSIAVARPQPGIGTVADLLSATGSITPPIQNLIIAPNAGSGYSPTEPTRGLSIDNAIHLSPSGLVQQSSGGGRSLAPVYGYGCGGVLTSRQSMMDTPARVTLPRIIVSRGDGRALSNALECLPSEACITGTLILSSNGRVIFRWDGDLHGMTESIAVYIVQHIKWSLVKASCIPATKYGQPITIEAQYQCWPDRGVGLVQKINE